MYHSTDYQVFSQRTKDEDDTNDDEDALFENPLYDQLDLQSSLVIAAVVLVLATASNAIVLKIYRQRKTDMNKKFVVTLAVVDIVSMLGNTRAGCLYKHAVLVWDLVEVFRSAKSSRDFCLWRW